ncbi:MAG: hypothetical protein LBW85_01255 [Deltaproteobacteria bacterium]|jgi:hypothetical protein|nr:hypothetical protein [Deltaproteobacteria bacterium]
MSGLAYVLANWKTVAAVLASLTLAATLHGLISLRSDNAALQARLADSAAVADSLRRDAEANRAALAAREAENRALAESHARDMAALRSAFASTPEACAWSEQRIPDPVLEALVCGR